MKIRFYIIFLFTIIFLPQTYSQKTTEQGIPFIKNYAPKDYKDSGQNWSIVQDSRGVMYFGNGDAGVMSFDGENFQFIKTPNNSTIRSLASDNNRIYAGAVVVFGFIESETTGKINYHSYFE